MKFNATHRRLQTNYKLIGKRIRHADELELQKPQIHRLIDRYVKYFSHRK